MRNPIYRITWIRRKGRLYAAFRSYPITESQNKNRSSSTEYLDVKVTVKNQNELLYLAKKFVSSLPLIQGSVIRLDAGNIMLDVGRTGGLKKGIKCTIYREGNEIKHPVTGEILGIETTIVGEIQITDPFDKYASGRITHTVQGKTINVGDKFITK